MKRHFSIVMILAALFVLFVSAGCMPPKITVTKAPVTEKVWPKPPEIPRVRFLHAITGPRDTNIEPGFFRKIAGFLKGEKQKRIMRPYGIGKDPAGRLYVVDAFYKAVHVFDSARGSYHTFPQKQIDNFRNPIDIAISASGLVFVSDSEANVVHVFSEQGNKYLRDIGKSRLLRPTGLAVNEKTGELLVVDTLASAIAVYGIDDLALKRIVGKDTKKADGFHYPTHITVSGEGLVYVTDSLNFRVQMLNSRLEFLGTFGSLGDKPGYFSRPKGLATDSQGHIYVVDALFDNVQIFDRDGKLLLAFGSPGHAEGEFWLPNSIFIDAQDRIHISDAYNRRIQVFQFLKQEVNKP